MVNTNGGAAGDSRSRFKNIPKILRDLSRWTTWKLSPTANGRMSKIPSNPDTGATISTLDPRNRLAWDRVDDATLLGFILTGRVEIELPDRSLGYLLAFDLDACRDPVSGAIVDWAAGFVMKFGNSYTEITPSGAGLRLWVLVRQPPNAMPKINITDPAPAGVDKKPEIQTFGCGPAGFVTVTGDQLPGTSADIEVVEDIAWMFRAFGVSDSDATDAALPVGEGDEPSLDLIAERVAGTEHGVDLIAGEWSALGLPSASECWWRLVRAVLRAARHHGTAAVEFLMTETAFGNGLVDSRDPDRYARRGWVETDVARIAGKQHEYSAAATFDDDFDSDGWAAADVPASGRVLQAAEHRAGIGSVEFIVYGVLPAHGKLGQIYGDPSCGKTPFAIHLSLHVALGLPTWFGHEIDAGGAVVYMVGEDGAGVSDRIAAQLAVLDPIADLADLPLFVTTEPGRLIDPANAAGWVKEIRAKVDGKVALLVVDTQNRNFGGGNENATEDMTKFVESIDQLARTLRCLVLLVHHTGHTNKQRSRGASVLPAALDVAFEIKKTGMAVRAICRKSKHAAECDPLDGSLVVAQIGVDDKGRPRTAITLHDQPPDAADIFTEADQDPQDMDIRRLLTTIRAAAKKGAGAKFSQAELMDALEVSRKAIRLRIQRARELGMIETAGGEGRSKTRYRLTPLGRDAIVDLDEGDLDVDELLS